MRVHLVKRLTLITYARENANLRGAVNQWLKGIKDARWYDPADIRNDFRPADLLRNGSHRVIFDLGGNNCRMICRYHFGVKMVHLRICWIGTHTEYDEICKNGLQYTINDY